MIQISTFEGAEFDLVLQDIQAHESIKDWGGNRAAHIKKLMAAIETNAHEKRQINEELKEFEPIEEMTDEEREDYFDLIQRGRRIE